MKKGKGKMPPYEGKLSEEEINAVVQYLANFKNAKADLCEVAQ